MDQVDHQDWFEVRRRIFVEPAGTTPATEDGDTLDEP
jgi:hypothetical protein